MNHSQLLPKGFFYACHVGTIVHTGERWTHHEVGKVDINQMATCLHLAEERYGFKRRSISVFAADLEKQGWKLSLQQDDTLPRLLGTASPAATVPMEEVVKHNSADSCWIVIQGKIYDVTDFLDKHPGGRKVLLSMGGRDATDKFTRIHPRGTLEVYQPEFVGCLRDAKP